MPEHTLEQLAYEIELGADEPSAYNQNERQVASIDLGHTRWKPAFYNRLQVMFQPKLMEQQRREQLMQFRENNYQDDKCSGQNRLHRLEEDNAKEDGQWQIEKDITTQVHQEELKIE